MAEAIFTQFSWIDSQTNFDTLFPFARLIKYWPIQPDAVEGVIWIKFSWNVASNFVLKFLLPLRLPSLPFYMWAIFSVLPHGMAKVITSLQILIKRSATFPRNSSQFLRLMDWLRFCHMPIRETITIANGNLMSRWSNLGHFLTHCWGLCQLEQNHRDWEREKVAPPKMLDR